MPAQVPPVPQLLLPALPSGRRELVKVALNRLLDLVRTSPDQLWHDWRVLLAVQPLGPVESLACKPHLQSLRELVSELLPAWLEQLHARLESRDGGGGGSGSSAGCGGGGGEESSRGGGDRPAGLGEVAQPQQASYVLHLVLSLLVACCDVLGSLAEEEAAAVQCVALLAPWLARHGKGAGKLFIFPIFLHHARLARSCAYEFVCISCLEACCTCQREGRGPCQAQQGRTLSTLRRGAGHMYMLKSYGTVLRWLCHATWWSNINCQWPMRLGGPCMCTCMAILAAAGRQLFQGAAFTCKGKVGGHCAQEAQRTGSELSPARSYYSLPCAWE